MQLIFKYINNILVFFILVAQVACSKKLINVPHSTYSKGNYSWNWYESSKQMPDSAWVTVHIKDDLKDVEMMASTITFGCKKVLTQEKQVAFKVKRLDNKHQLQLASLGYFTIETMPFNFIKGDSVVINFLLYEDDRPLINCNGIH